MSDVGKIHRGDVFYIHQLDDAGNRTGSRPGIVVSADSVCDASNLLTVVFMTRRTNTDSPCHVTLTAADSSHLDGSIVLAAQTTTVRYCQIGDYIATVSEISMHAIEAAMFIGLGLVPVSKNAKRIEGCLKMWLDRYQEEPLVGPSASYEQEIAAQEAAEKESVAHVEDDVSDFVQDDMSGSCQDDASVPAYVYHAAQEEALIACTERDVYKNLYHQLIMMIVDKK